MARGTVICHPESIRVPVARVSSNGAIIGGIKWFENRLGPFNASAKVISSGPHIDGLYAQ